MHQHVSTVEIYATKTRIIDKPYPKQKYTCICHQALELLQFGYMKHQKSQNLEMLQKEQDKLNVDNQNWHQPVWPVRPSGLTGRDIVACPAETDLSDRSR